MTGMSLPLRVQQLCSIRGNQGQADMPSSNILAEGDLSAVTPLGNIRTTWPGYITNIGVDRNGYAYVSGTFAGSLFTGSTSFFLSARCHPTRMLGGRMSLSPSMR